MADPGAYGSSWLGVKSELSLLAYATATAMPDLSCIFDLYHSLWRCRILNPLRETRDGTHILRILCCVLNPLSHNRNSWSLLC